jgi:hypothetical protein
MLQENEEAAEENDAGKENRCNYTTLGFRNDELPRYNMLH